MTHWETAVDDEEAPAVARDFARIWRAADKVVFSRTLERPATARTGLERELDPEAGRRLKAGADRDLAVGGAELAGQALAAGLVDELHLFLHQVVVDAGKPTLPAGLRLGLELRDQHRFAGGVVFLRYDVG